MALSAVLGKEGFVPESIRTRAEATMDPGMDPGPTITGITLVLNAKVPGIDQATFERIANAAGRAVLHALHQILPKAYKDQDRQQPAHEKAHER